MPTAGLVAETLSAWREAERVLDRLPPGTRDHARAQLLVDELHDLFLELTDERDESAERLASSRSTILQARNLLESFGVAR
jgi:hypothetical protein